METVVSDSDHGAGELRPGAASPDYERAVNQASELVVAHLKACPDDVRLSRERREEGPTLYAAVRATFPELDRMRLTSIMWDQVANQAVESFLGEGAASGGGGAGAAERDGPTGGE